MCGLFGLVTSSGIGPGELLRARRARDVLTHRGPDQAGEACVDEVYLGHRRLSILDLSDKGRQPMVSSDGFTAIAVNGEIYNHKELRAVLGGGNFTSQSDSEVVLHGYRAWGLNVLSERLEGMYAIAVHDRRAHKLHLIRDRVGIKPLYYGRIGGRFVFGSELSSIVAFCESRPHLDSTAAYDALTYGYVPSPKTIYHNISKLEPASILTLDCNTGSFVTRRYWNVSPGEAAIAPHEAEATVRGLIDESVANHMMSDVPVGFFLSGGIDSAIVLTHGAHIHPMPSAYTIGFDNPAHTEVDRARSTAQHVGAIHEVDVMSRASSNGLLGRMAGWFHEPFADTSALPTHRVSSLARKSAVVALTGDGGDELFGGYSWYRREIRLRPYQRALSRLLPVVPSTPSALRGPNLLRRLGSAIDQLTRVDLMSLHAYLLGDRLSRSAKGEWRLRLDIADDYDDYWHFRKHDDPTLPLPKRLQVLDFKTYLPDDILTKVDRVSMAVSLEVRVPLLATSIVDFAFSLPNPWHLTRDETKQFLRSAYSNRLPSSVLTGPKRGFSIPAASWGTGVLPEGYRTFSEAVVDRFLENS